MNDPATDIKEVIRILLAGQAGLCQPKVLLQSLGVPDWHAPAGSISEREKVIDTCFTPDAKFIHPLLLLRGRHGLASANQP